MGRLLKGALYTSNPMNEEHRLRVQRYDNGYFRDISASCADDWGRAAKEAEKVDPDGSRSLAIIKRMELEYKLIA